MVERMQPKDLETVMSIWLEENCRSHFYIARSYWQEHFEMVRQAVAQAEVWVYKEAGQVKGFVGLEENWIQGIFVQEKAQGSGIGRQLLDAVKAQHEKLDLTVYEKNDRAIRFYQRLGFVLRQRQLDAPTGEMEWQMRWSKEDSFS